MILPDVSATIITALSGVAVALITGILTVLASRNKTKSDVQVTINDGFSKLVDKLNENIRRQDDRLVAQDETIRDQDHELNRLRTDLKMNRDRMAELLFFLRENKIKHPFNNFNRGRKEEANEDE